MQKKLTVEDKVKRYIERQPDTWHILNIVRAIGAPAKEVKEAVIKLGFEIPGPGVDRSAINRQSHRTKQISTSIPTKTSKKGFTLKDLKKKYDIGYRIKEVIDKMPTDVLYTEEELREEVGQSRSNKWFHTLNKAEIKYYALLCEDKRTLYGPRKSVLKFHAQLPDSKLLQED